MIADTSWVSVVALLGWLILAGSAFASYKLSWKKGLSLALIWAAIFTTVALFVAAIGH